MTRAERWWDAYETAMAARIVSGKVYRSEKEMAAACGADADAALDEFVLREGSAQFEEPGEGA